MLYIGADHGGFPLKEYLKQWFLKKGIEYSDLGAETLALDDDYPVYAKKVASKASGAPDKHVGLLLCRSGQGVAIAANKFKGVRAVVIWNEAEARASKHDDGANVLCLPTDYITQKQAERIVGAWLATPFSNEARHVRRLKQIARLEK